jgi:CSLREA domain-containing protein
LARVQARSRVLVCASVGVLLGAAAPASAVTYEPTRFDDPAPGNCKPKDCSLREAIKASNASTDVKDRIVLEPGDYELTIPNGGSGLDNGSLDLVDGVTIRGRGRFETRIDAKNVDQVFTGWNNGGEDAFRIEDLALGNGKAEMGFQDHGGAFLVGESNRLTVVGVTMTLNSAPASGGAIAAFDDSVVVVKRSELGINTANFGGAIEFQGATLLVKQSSITGNTASEGAGLDLRPNDTLPATRIVASTIASNKATNKGGGMLVDGLPFAGGDPAEDPEVDIKNSTIAFNRANNDAGGIMGDNLAVVDVENSTIAHNRANDDETGTAVAGGVYQHSNASFSVDDSVIAHNETGQGGSNDDCSATQVFSGAGNAISSQTGCSVSFTEPFNVYSNDPIVPAVIGDFGGPTITIKLAPGSVAKGFANDCPKRDQRGKLRPNNCDSGSFENQPKRR